MMRAFKVIILSFKWIGTLLVFLAFGCQTAPQNGLDQRLVLWYDSPATDWSKEALPIGNGRLGAMVFGDPVHERIQLNEDSMWPGGPDWGNATGNEEDLKLVRSLLVNQDVHEADRQWVEKFSHKSIVRSHQTMGDLHIDFPNREINNYRRELDLNTAIVTTSYEANSYKITQRVLATLPHNAIAIQLETTDPVGQDFSLRLSRPDDQGVPTVSLSNPSDNEISMDGMVTQLGGKHFSEPAPLDYGVKFQTRLIVKNEGGTVVAMNGSLSLKGVKKATIYLVCASSFYHEDFEGENQQDLDRISPIGFDRVLKDHVNDYQSLFSRVDLDLGGHELDSLPTNKRLERIQTGEKDPDFVAKQFQFGRYLLISSSRPGTNPANLQGLWNEHIQAPWNADYHLNINLQMNYWPAEVTNLSECQNPLFDFSERLIERGRITAKEQYNMRGFVAHHATDLWAPAWMRAERPYWGAWVGGGGWLMQHFWDRYQFTQDKDFLKNRAYPALKESALFYLDWLVKEPGSRNWVSSPSTSPENSYMAKDGKSAATLIGSAIDQQIIEEVFINSLAAAKELGIEDDFTKEVKEKLANLKSGTIIGEDGRILEWDQPYEEPEKGHRHMSHLYAIYPGQRITNEGTPELMAAVKKSTDFRLENGGAGTGWSRAWLINLSARLLDGNEVENHVNLHLQKSIVQNLFDMHPPFQIDGNFGFTSGIAEALLQSHSGQIHLLPALPHGWQSGKIGGLKARGNLTVDVEWENGILKSALIVPEFSGEYKIKYDEKSMALNMKAGERYHLNGKLETLR